MSLESHYRELDLEPTATREEVKRAYKDLVKVWHPDRFANNPRLRAKAEQKLKRINIAYQFILEHSTAPSATPERPRSHEDRPNRQRPETVEEPTPGNPWSARNLLLAGLGLFLVAFAGVVTRYLSNQSFEAPLAPQAPADQPWLQTDPIVEQPWLKRDPIVEEAWLKSQPVVKDESNDWRDKYRVVKEAEPAGGPGMQQGRITPDEFDRQWKTLRSGETLMGPDGKLYRKRASKRQNESMHSQGLNSWNSSLPPDPGSTYERQSLTSTRISPFTFYDGTTSDGRSVSGTTTRIGRFRFHDLSDSDGNTASGTSTRIGRFDFHDFSTSSGESIHGTSTDIGRFRFHDFSTSRGSTFDGTSTRIGNFNFHDFTDSEGNTTHGTTTIIGGQSFTDWNE